jgi:hypothetical protein
MGVSFVALSDGAIVGFAHLWISGADEVELFARTWVADASAPRGDR